MSAIDLDFPSTWPAELRELAGNAVGLQGCTSQNTAIRPPRKVASGIDAILSEYGVVVYHCTRLLDAEVTDVRQHGLRVASADLLDRKLMSAVEAGHLSGEHAAHLHETSILADKNQDSIRTNRLSALSIRRTIDLEARDGLWRFLRSMGW